MVAVFLGGVLVGFAIAALFALAYVLFLEPAEPPDPFALPHPRPVK